MDTGLLVVRLIVGLTLAGHGAQKLLGWFDGPGLRATTRHFEQLGYRPGMVFAVAAGLAEALGGVLLAMGLLTPLAAAALVVVMVEAAVSAHLRNGFWLAKDGIEYAVVLGGVAAGLAFTGSGRDGVDALLGWHLNGTWWGELAVALALATSIAIEVYRRQLWGHPQPHVQPASSRASAVESPHGTH